MYVATVRPPTSSQFEVPFADCWITPAARRAALRVLSSGWVTTGSEVSAFEREFAAAVGARHAVATSSRTAALELGLRSLCLRPGAAVLASDVTSHRVVQAILHAGLRPVLVDVDAGTGLPTPTTMARAARQALAAGEKPAAVVVTHVGGDPADVEALATAAGLSHRRVVEDAADALGAQVGGRRIGAGAAACFSFEAAQNLPIGGGGMITGDDDERVGLIRRMRSQGRAVDERQLPGAEWPFDVTDDGLEAELADLEAAIGRVQLRHLNEWQHRRAQIATRYDGGLADVRGIRRPHRPARATGRHAWHLYAAQVDTRRAGGRDAVAAALAARGVGTSVQAPIHQLSWFRRQLGLADGDFPGAQRWAARQLCLPIYPRLDGRQVEDVCQAVADVMRGGGRTA